jgi:phospholipid transport system substrate-binding protein
MTDRENVFANAQASRRSVFTLAAAALLATTMPRQKVANAQSAGDAAAGPPIAQLDDALLAAMKAGRSVPFADRYRALAPKVERSFDLEVILATSVGVNWGTLPESQRTTLIKIFRRYAISSYVANFDTYNGETFQLLPAVRPVGNGNVLVQTKLLSTDGSSVAFDYVMHDGVEGWRAVDVLADGSISRVATQRSDFRALLTSGGVQALATGLERKVASLSGGVV